jgi:hypothetical protein
LFSQTEGRRTSTRNKSFFASFFSKKEDSSFSQEKEAKGLLFLVLSHDASQALIKGWVGRLAFGRELACRCYGSG